jgi:hypothetical protein
MVSVAVCAVFVPPALPQDAAREARAREYVQFLATELDQWTRDFPKAYDMAMVRPPVDASRLSEDAKAGADGLRDSISRLRALSQAKDPMTSAPFRAQLEKTLAFARPVNEALGAARFPDAIQEDWVQIRTVLNSLADIYKAPELAALEAPAAGGGKNGNKALAEVPAGALVGYVVDQRCAARGKGMWTNAQCVQTCVRDGDRIVLVTEQGKVFQIANQDKVDTDNYGQKVAITGKLEADTITVASVRGL